MNIKTLRFVFLSVLLALTLLGCGGSQSEGNAGTSTAGNATAAHQSETENTIKN
jgi:hypothetical protein